MHSAEEDDAGILPNHLIPYFYVCEFVLIYYKIESCMELFGYYNHSGIASLVITQNNAVNLLSSINNSLFFSASSFCLQ